MYLCFLLVRECVTSALDDTADPVLSQRVENSHATESGQINMCSELC